MKTFEILNDGAFVVTNKEDELVLGFYHDVFDEKGDTTRIFEPIGPINIFSINEIINYIMSAK